MKWKIIGIVLVFLMVAFNATNNSNGGSTSENNKKNKEKVIYKYDKSINSFLNKYNKINDPDITSDMVSKRHSNGKDHDDIVNISNDRFQIIVYGKGMFGDEMDVFIGYGDGTGLTNDDFKEQFTKFVKVYDSSLKDKQINEYWNNMLLDQYENHKLKNIDVSPNISNGKIQYYKIEGDIEFK